MLLVIILIFTSTKLPFIIPIPIPKTDSLSRTPTHKEFLNYEPCAYTYNMLMQIQITKLTFPYE